MDRREFVKRTGAAALAVAGSSAYARAETAGAKRPNILLIFSDQQHWQALGFMDPFFATPNLDGLAEESVVFERSFCSTPQCSPSRSSLLTGFYPSTTDVLGNVGAAGGNSLAIPTIGKELQDANYVTGYFGKWHLGGKAVATAGWDHHDFATNDRKAESGALEFLKTKRDESRPFALFVSINNPHDVYAFKRHKSNRGDVPMPPSWAGETFDGKPPIQKQFMEEDQGKAIHGHPRDEWQKYRDCYRSKTELYDRNVGAILDELKRQGQWDNTIIIVTSDHGDMDTQHKLIFKGPFMYEHMMRVPLMIRVPRAFSTLAPRRIKETDVVNVDIVPTIRDFCSLPSRNAHGLSLAPLFSKPEHYTPRDFVIGQYYSKQKWVNPIRMIRTGDYKLNRHIPWGDELYDLKHDPHELTNLADDPHYADIKRDLETKLDRWLKEHDDPFYALQATSRQGETLD
ncbi:MAG: sulfatase-like hydrolase/transferase [Verrucomicrobia bacterium]|jgi:arylsulfatase|nr:sulfatase-like hydrolase/transferase [Verrucomicrobiota bacterium]